MRTPRTVLAAAMDQPWVRRPGRRRAVVVVLALILVGLSLWPRSYVARAQMLPDDSAHSLSSLLGAPTAAGGGLLGSLLGGGRPTIETDLTISRSHLVLEDVVRRLRDEHRLTAKDPERDASSLQKKLDIEAIRGGLLQISVRDGDPAFARAAVGDYVAAVRFRLANLDLEQTAQKKALAANRMAGATASLAASQAELDRFRLENHLAAPEAQLGPAVSLVTGLQAKLQADEADLQTLSQFATGQNLQLQAARARVAADQGQLAAAQTSANHGGGPSVGGLTPQLNRYENLFRAEKYAEAQYDIYRRYLDAVSIDELSAPINMDLIEPPYIDPQRQYNLPAVGALGLLILLAALAEAYLANPPVGAREPRP